MEACRRCEELRRERSLLQTALKNAFDRDVAASQGDLQRRIRELEEVLKYDPDDTALYSGSVRSHKLQKLIRSVTRRCVEPGLIMPGLREQAEGRADDALKGANQARERAGSVPAVRRDDCAQALAERRRELSGPPGTSRGWIDARPALRVGAFEPRKQCVRAAVRAFCRVVLGWPSG
eukprot:3744795-Rhodomonas_salina.6